jgi:hypothetical protein
MLVTTSTRSKPLALSSAKYGPISPSFVTVHDALLVDVAVAVAVAVALAVAVAVARAVAVGVAFTPGVALGVGVTVGAVVAPEEVGVAVGVAVARVTTEAPPPLQCSRVTAPPSAAKP